MNRASLRTSIIVCLGVAALSAGIWRPGALNAQGLTPASGKLDLSCNSR